MKQLAFTISLYIFSISICFTQSQVDLNKTVFLEADVNYVENSITLKWEKLDGATGYFIYGKEINSPAWGLPLAELSESDSSYTILNITPGELYEFRVFRLGAAVNANGYIYSGIEYSSDPFTKAQIIVIEDIIYDAIPATVDEYISRLKQESIDVRMIIANKDELPSDLKQDIQEQLEDLNQSNISVLLLGNIPVPYSGNIGPDGHGNHIGAWPCDGYYGDLDGIWTDEIVTNVSGGSQRTHNIPGDGKFDQSSFPSEIELAIGRTDFSALPLFEQGEIELTRRYLEKNLAFRRGEISTNFKGLVENNFGHAEGFGQNGYKNLTSLLGRENTYRRDYDSLLTSSYLWSYGAGGGNYQGASGISNTTRLSTDSLQTIFTMLFGSYFGDFDVNNNFLRAALASGTTLSNAWAGRPNWYFHPMGMGFNLAHCTKLVMNNANTYDTGFGGRQVHIALMGDPSLKMYYNQNEIKFDIIDTSGHAILKWDKNAIDSNLNVLVYKSMDGGIPEFLDRVSIKQGQSTDSCLMKNTDYTYFVTTEELNYTPTGSFWNHGLFNKESLNIGESYALSGEISTNNQYNTTVEFSIDMQNANTILWDFGDGNSSTDISPIHNYDSLGIYTVSCTISNNCETLVLEEVIQLSASSTDDFTFDNLVYPNPTDKYLYVKNENFDFVEINFFTSNGTLLEIKKLKEGHNQIDISHLPSGLLLVSLIGSKPKQLKIKHF